MKCKSTWKPFVLNLDERVFHDVRKAAGDKGLSITSWMREAVIEKIEGEHSDSKLSEIKRLYANLNENGREWLRSSAVLASNHEEMKEGGK